MTLPGIPVKVYLDPYEAMRTAKGPSMIMFGPEPTAATIVGWAADGRAICLLELQMDADMVMQIARLSDNGLIIALDTARYGIGKAKS